jgi:apolipoprotein N-acyltransferase
MTCGGPGQDEPGTPGRAELLRRRRCRLLLLAMALGIFLPISQPGWITVAAAVAGIGVLAFLYRRDCWRKDGTDAAP